MKMASVVNEQFTEDSKTIAIEYGLVYPKTGQAELFYVHPAIAEFCAAYFWFKSTRLVVNDILLTSIEFVEPKGGSCAQSSLMSSCFGYFNREYKLTLWKSFRYVVPLLDEYESLPKRVPIFYGEDILLSFTKNHSVTDQNFIMTKIDFSDRDREYYPLTLVRAKFESGVKFENIAMFKKVTLNECSLNLSPSKFFHYYNFNSVVLINCSCNNAAFNEKLGTNFATVRTLENLDIRYSDDYSMLQFLPYIMKNCNTLVSFKLRFESEVKLGQTLEKETNISVGHLQEITKIGNNEATEVVREDVVGVRGSSSNFKVKKAIVAGFGNDWMLNLRNNDKLVKSLKFVQLEVWYPFDLTSLFETLVKLVHLSNLSITLDSCNLSGREVDALSDSFKNGLQCLEVLELSFISESDKKLLISENLFHLSNLKILCLKNILFKEDSIVKLFNVLKLEECTLSYQEIFLHETVLSAINSCATLKKMVLKVEKRFSISFEIFSNYLLLMSFSVKKENLSNYHLFLRNHLLHKMQ